MKQRLGKACKTVNRFKWLVAAFVFGLNLFAGLIVSTIPAYAAGEEYGINYNKNDEGAINDDLGKHGGDSDGKAANAVYQKTAAYAIGGAFQESQPVRFTPKTDASRGFAHDNVYVYESGSFVCQGYRIRAYLQLELPDPIKQGGAKGNVTYQSIRDPSGKLITPSGNSFSLTESQVVNALPGMCRPANYGKVNGLTAINLPYNTSRQADFGVGGGGGGGGSGGTNDNTDPNEQMGCEVEFTNALTWVICPVVVLLSDMVSGIDAIITTQLEIDSDEVFCSNETCDAYRKAWTAFRNIALGLMVVAGLLVLIAQALGMEILDAYTIRKVLPRLLIVAIGITISWPIMKFLVELTNDLGYGVRSLILVPFSQLDNDIDISGNLLSNLFQTLGLATVAGTATGVALWAGFGGIGALLAYLGTAALAVLVGVVILVLRQIIILGLIIAAPIFIISYILPNTQKFYKFWWDIFFKALLMFPMIVAFIAVGRVFSAISLNNQGGVAGLNQFIGFVAYFAPYFMIPLTVKFAGGAMRQIGGFVNDRSRGSFDRLAKFRETRRQKGRERIMGGNLYKNAAEGSWKARKNQAWQSAALGAAHIDELGANPYTWRRKAAALRGGHHLHDAEKILQSDEFKPVLGDDDFGKAAMKSEGSAAKFREYLRNTGKFTEQEITQKASHFELLRQKYGDGALNLAAFQSTLMASTSYSPTDEGRAEMLQDLVRVSEGDQQVMAQTIGKVKDLAPKAGRQDLAAPFSALYDQARKISYASTEEAREAASIKASRFLADVNTEVEGPAYWLQGKGAATESGVASIQRKIHRAAANVVAAQNSPNGRTTVTKINENGQEVQVEITAEQAQNEMVETLAQVQGTADNLAAVSPEKQRLFVDGVLNQTIPGFKTTVQQEIDNVSDNEVFTQLRSKYERESVRKAEEYRMRSSLAGDADAQRQAEEAARRHLGGDDPGGLKPPLPGGGI